jgi:uncharacterized damage-inducible protein DinB
MKRMIVSLVVMAFLLAMGAVRSHAQAAPAAAPSLGNVRDEAWRNFDSAASKILRLADVIPAEKYTWRPGEGVRSVSEVLLHITNGNFNYSSRIGATRPDDIDFRNLEKSTTDKAKIIELLKRSIETVRSTFESADPDKTRQSRDREMTYREVMFQAGAHAHEHLGQLIAYARMNGITPPWTEEQQQRQQQQPPAKRP